MEREEEEDREVGIGSNFCRKMGTIFEGYSSGRDKKKTPRILFSIEENGDYISLNWINAMIGKTQVKLFKNSRTNFMGWLIKKRMVPMKNCVVQKEVEDKKENALPIDHGEEGVKKTESSDIKNSVTVWIQESKNQLHGLVDEIRFVSMYYSVVYRELEVNHEVEEEDKIQSSDENYLDQEKREKKTDNVGHEDTPPEMPQEIKSRILELFGENSIVSEKLIMQKEVEKTDCCVIRNRLLIPRGKLLLEFLEADEKKILPRIVNIIEPGLLLGEVKLSSALRIGDNKVYVLNGKWGKVRARNSIVPGLIVQLFVVRLGNGLRGKFREEDGLENLWSVLVDITPADLKARLIMEAVKAAPNADGGSTSSSARFDEGTSASLSSVSSDKP